MVNGVRYGVLPRVDATMDPWQHSITFNYLARRRNYWLKISLRWFSSMPNMLKPLAPLADAPLPSHGRLYPWQYTTMYTIGPLAKRPRQVFAGLDYSDFKN